MNAVLPVPSRVGERGRTSAMKRSNGVHCFVHRPAKQTTGLVSVRMTMIDPGLDDCI